MRIGEIAKSTGIGVEAIRFYECKGLIFQPPRPASGGYRDYPTGTVHRIRFIRSAQQLGFSLQEINELLTLESGPASQCVDVRRRAETKRREVLAKIENLTRIRAALDAPIDARPGNTTAQGFSRRSLSVKFEPPSSHPEL